MLYSNCKEIKILFVDDERKIAKSMKSALSNYFDKFIVASNGLQALKIFKKENPDLLITDIMMPKMDGLSLIKEIRDSHPNFPIIVQSAYSDRDNLLEVIEIGVSRYFIKPVDIDELLRYIGSLVTKIKASWIANLIDGYVFNRKNKSLYHNQKIIHLTKREVVFMELLIGQKDMIVDMVTIKKRLWKNYRQVSNDMVRTFVKRLRQKTSKGLIVNAHNEGYMTVYL
jgi:DNA-binding response OmpR family regulator